jgi:DNA-binding NarL/FixJ family response regulator
MSPQAAKQPITVVIADDHRSFGEALEVALDKERDLRVIEVVTDGQSAIDSATKEHPDVVLMDLQMPGVDGIEATRRIHDESTGTAVIILSGQQADEIGLARAIQAGARGYLRKTEAVGGLADAIRRAYRGEPLHTSAEVEESLRRLRRRRAQDGNLAQRIERLTPRELEILQHMANGATSEQIASELGMSKHTLRTHTQNVLTKLGVHSKLDAIVAAIRYGKVQTVDVTPADEFEEGGSSGEAEGEGGGEGGGGAEGEEIHEIEDLGEVERAKPPETS